MEVLIATRNLELNPQTEEYVQKKLGPVGRRLRDDMEAKVEIRREPTRSALHRVVVQVTLNVNGVLLRAEERGPNVNAAIDVVARALDRKVSRFKGRRFKSLRARKGGQDSSSIRSPDVDTEELDTSGEETDLPGGKVVRVKRFPMKPLALEEAAAQMELLGHDFFFFINASTEKYNVLYRRRDGNYTVIEPDAA